MSPQLHHSKQVLLNIVFPADSKIRMFARLNELEGRMASRLPQFLNTHPATQERVDVSVRSASAAFYANKFARSSCSLIFRKPMTSWLDPPTAILSETTWTSSTARSQRGSISLILPHKQTSFHRKKSSGDDRTSFRHFQWDRSWVHYNGIINIWGNTIHSRSNSDGALPNESLLFAFTNSFHQLCGSLNLFAYGVNFLAALRCPLYPTL